MTRTPSEEAETGRLKQKFGQGTDQTRVFEDWDASVLDFFASRLRLAEGEVPIFAHYKEPSSWLVTTSMRVIWANPGDSSNELRNEDIKKVAWSSGPKGWPGRVPNYPPDTLVFVEGSPGVTGHCCRYSPWLYFMDYSETRHEAFLESGDILRAIRNTIWKLSGGWQRSIEDAKNEGNHAQVGSDAYRASRMEFTFLKYPSSNRTDTQTALFSAFDSDVQECMKRQAALGSEELSVIAFFENPDKWLLATSRRILWTENEDTSYLWYRDIVRMGWSYGPDGPHPCSHEHATKGNGKPWCKICISSSPWFFVTATDGKTRQIAIEPGSASHLWDCFRLMCRLEQIHPRGDSGLI